MNVKIYLFYSISSKDVAWLYPIMDSLMVKYTWWQQQGLDNFTLNTEDLKKKMGLIGC
jgi:hypothetical protein